MAAFADESWGAGSGSAWTVAQGADRDWSQVVGSGTWTDDIVSGNGEFSHDASGRRRAYMLVDGVDQLDGEILLTFTPGPDERVGGVVMRSDGATNSNVYYLGINEVGSNSNYYLANVMTIQGVGISKQVADAYTLLGESSKTITDVEWAVRAQIVGDALKCRAWPTSGGEPGSWDVEVTDGDLTAADQVGIFVGSNGFPNYVYASFLTDDLASSSFVMRPTGDG
jgi:hypothetical protein